MASTSDVILAISASLQVVTSAALVWFSFRLTKVEESRERAAFEVIEARVWRKGLVKATVTNTGGRGATITAVSVTVVTPQGMETCRSPWAKRAQWVGEGLSEREKGDTFFHPGERGWLIVDFQYDAVKGVAAPSKAWSEATSFEVQVVHTGGASSAVGARIVE